MQCEGGTEWAAAGFDFLLRETKDLYRKKKLAFN